MKAAAIVGFKNSGKTTLTLEVARTLKERGLAVAAAKFAHHGFDYAGRDTDRLAAHCTAVAGVSEESSMLIWPGRRRLEDLVPLMRADVLLVEGGKSLDVLPRILVLREESEARDLNPELALGAYGNTPSLGLAHFENPDAVADAILEHGFLLPGLNCEACGRASCHNLAAEIVAGQAESDDCRAFPENLRVECDGKPLPLGPFVASIVGSTIRGLLSELKGYTPGPVTIKLDQ
ncbi:MAG: molybdopterin-guanine dinucleotide biosynthesis protein MobB [Oceanidesulfovibrio sp.]